MAVLTHRIVNGEPRNETMGTPQSVVHKIVMTDLDRWRMIGFDPEASPMAAAQRVDLDAMIPREVPVGPTIS